jgi:acyl-CoA thioester hydrolase
MSIEPSTESADYDFVQHIRARFVETDAMGIVHHSNYLPWFEEARVAYLRHIDHPFTQWREEGLESPVLESFVQYIRPVEFDQVVGVHVKLGSVSRASFQMAYLVTDEADAVAHSTGVTVHACTSNGRPTRLPEWLTALA